MAVPILAAIGGGLASGAAGGLLNNLFGGGGSKKSSSSDPLLGYGSPTIMSPDYAGQAQLYLAQMAPYNTRLSIEASDLAANRAPYLAAKGAQQQVLGQGQYDIFDASKQKDLSESNLRLGLAGQYGKLAADVLGQDASTKQGIEALAPYTVANMSQDYLKNIAAIEGGILSKEGDLFNSTATGLASAGLGALQNKNQAAQAYLTANLNLRTMQAQTENDLAKIQSNFLGQMALKNQDSSRAFAAFNALA